MRTLQALRIGQVYYSPCPARPRLYIKLKWEGSEFDYTRLTRGLVHTTSVSAVKQAAAMLEVSLDN
jgi:hypothetical protein